MELWPHQVEFLGDLRESLKHKAKSVVACLSTGGGKTVIASTMLQTATARGKHTIFMVHRKVLIKQVSRTLTAIGVPHSFIAAGYPYDPEALCHIAIVNTLSRRIDKLAPPDFLIVDEAHIMMGNMAMKVIDWAKDAYTVCLTATPKRFDGKGLKRIAKELVLGKPMSWLIEHGYLSRYKYYAPAGQMQGIAKIKHGDYDVTEVAREGSRLIGDVVASYTQFAKGKKALLFAPTIQVSMEVVAAMEANGIRSAHLDGTDGEEVRVEAIEAFANGDIDVLCNVALMTEGFDLSSYVGREVPIEAVILYTKTASVSKFLQIIGRGLRPKPSPAIIIDHGNNYLEHGMPDDAREWSLEDSERKSKGTKGIVQIMTCKKCYAVHKPAPVCPECGHTHVMGRKVKIVDGELVEVVLSPNKYKQAYNAEYARLKAIQEKNNYKLGWIFWKMMSWKSTYKTESDLP